MFHGLLDPNASQVISSGTLLKESNTSFHKYLSYRDRAMDKTNIVPILVELGKILLSNEVINKQDKFR